MPIIYANDLSAVALELSRRKVKLCHACQLVDFKSYLHLGGIPSRHLLATRELPYTEFATDERDKENDVWRLVFFNLSDFGAGFAKGGKNLPNIYGPILLCFDPRVICQAVDVSIALRSAGAEDFDRVGEGIDSDDVPRLFKDNDSRCVRFAPSLREEFGRPEARSPEMSLFFRDEVAPLSHLAYIVVDPYNLADGSLIDIVRQAIEGRSESSRVVKRRCADGCEVRYQILLDAILSGVRRASQLRHAIPDDSPMSDWRDAILQSTDLSFQFGRYARYLFEGTVDQCI